MICRPAEGSEGMLSFEVRLRTMLELLLFRLLVQEAKLRVLPQTDVAEHSAKKKIPAKDDMMRNRKENVFDACD